MTSLEVPSTVFQMLLVISANKYVQLPLIVLMFFVYIGQ